MTDCDWIVRALILCVFATSTFFIGYALGQERRR